MPFFSKTKQKPNHIKSYCRGNRTHKNFAKWTLGKKQQLQTHQRETPRREFFERTVVINPKFREFRKELTVGAALKRRSTPRKSEVKVLVGEEEIRLNDYIFTRSVESFHLASMWILAYKAIPELDSSLMIIKYEHILQMDVWGIMFNLGRLVDHNWMYTCRVLFQMWWGPSIYFHLEYKTVTPLCGY